jgi:poly(3-hydroxybutyrate) depolymerase
VNASTVALLPSTLWMSWRTLLTTLQLVASTAAAAAVTINTASRLLAHDIPDLPDVDRLRTAAEWTSIRPRGYDRGPAAVVTLRGVGAAPTLSPQRRATVSPVSAL